MSSPPGRSTFTTRAPASASIKRGERAWQQRGEVEDGEPGERLHALKLSAEERGRQQIVRDEVEDAGDREHRGSRADEDRREARST